MASSFCKICKVKFESDSSLLSHINIHIGRKCKHCNKLFKSSFSEKTCNDQCKESHLWIAQLSALKSSEPSPPPPSSLPSNTISKPNTATQNPPPPSSLPSNTISKPNTATQNPPPPTLQCQYCSYCTHCNTRFKKHMRCHTNERPYKCDECGKAFTVKCNLVNHIRSVHKKERKYKCKFCGNGFIRSDRLKEHERIHTGEKPLKCEFCWQRFATSSRLHKHRKQHTGYQCRFCDDKVTFKTEYQLKQHKKATHSNIIKKKASNYIVGKRWFPFGCKYCGLRFLEKDLLETHSTEHAGLICSKCDTLFATKIVLAEHKATCNGIKVVKEMIKIVENDKKVYTNKCNGSKQHYCLDCDRYFPSGQSLGGHRSRIHCKDRKKRTKSKGNGKKKRKKKSCKVKKQNIRTKDTMIEMDCILSKQDAMNRRMPSYATDDMDCGMMDSECDLGLDIKYKNEEELRLEHAPLEEDTRKKKKQIEICEGTKDCPGRHGLILTMTANNRVFECAECNKTMYLNEEMYRCKWCDYDLCMACFKGESNALDECKTMSDTVVPIETEPDCNSRVNIQRIVHRNDKKRKREDVSMDHLGTKPPTKKRKKFIIRIPRIKRKTN